MNTIKVENLYTGEGLFKNASVSFEASKIVSVGENASGKSSGEYHTVTLAKGKWASFVCWNGDPFEMSSYPVAIYAEGMNIFSA